MTSLAPARFPKTARVRSRAAYACVFENARRTHHSALTLHVAPATAADARPRLGMAVSRKVDGRAVGRNRIKRILRDAFRRRRGALASGAYVLVARNAAARADAATLRATFERLLQRAGALPASATAGTMRPACPPPSPSPSTPDACPAGSSG